MVQWYLKVVRDNYANFEGRARRSEFWYYVLMNFLIGVAFGILAAFAGFFNYIQYLYSLVVLVPGIAVGVRRLHDIDKSGWFLLLLLVPLVNIWVIILLATEGTRGPNQYGADPKNLVEFNDSGTPQSY